MRFSLIITAHDEGELADATMKSVRRAVRFWQQIEQTTDDDYEIIVHIDNGTQETIKYFSRYIKMQSVKVLKNKFGDVGPARNAAVEQAQGEFAFFVDADDLISENYIAETLKVLDVSDNEIVVCPEYCIGFSDDGKRGSILKMESSKTREQDAFRLFNVNLWIVAIAGRRETFLTHPYIETKDGYGHEDYALNIELTAAGIPHKVAPEAIYFYRQKQESRQKWNNSQKHTQPYSKLFTEDFWKKLPEEVTRTVRTEARSATGRLKQLYLKVRGNKVARALLMPATELSRATLSRRLIKENLPKGVGQEWQEIEKIEPKVKRKDKRVNAMGILGVNPYCPASEAYLRICRKGFAEIDFEEDAKGLDLAQRDLLMSRIMVQSRGKANFINKKCLEEWVREHAELERALGVRTDG